MKKILSTILTILVILLCGCASNENDPTRQPQTEGLDPRLEPTELFIPDTATPSTHITIESGTSSIAPIGVRTWSKTQNQDGTYTEKDYENDGAALTVADIPTIVIDGELKYYVQVNGKVESVTLLVPQGDKFYSRKADFDELSALDAGRYYVALEVLLSGNCDPDAPQNSYRYTDFFCLVVEERQVADLTMYRYAPDGYGISEKTLTDSETAYEISAALKALKKTGKTEKKISGISFEESIKTHEIPVERRTMWLESEGKIYRIDPDMKQICRVEKHYGKGEVLEMTDELRTAVNNAWYYAPYRWYRGEHTKGDPTVELKKVFDGKSSVDVSVKDISLSPEYGGENTVTLVLTSTLTQNLNVRLNCQQSIDNLGAGDDEYVSLIKDTPQEVTLSFSDGGWSYYWITVIASDTRAEITITE